MAMFRRRIHKPKLEGKIGLGRALDARPSRRPQKCPQKFENQSKTSERCLMDAGAPQKFENQSKTSERCLMDAGADARVHPASIRRPKSSEADFSDAGRTPASTPRPAVRRSAQPGRTRGRTLVRPASSAIGQPILGAFLRLKGSFSSRFEGQSIPNPLHFNSTP
uniref:Uncharacterized protein n=1 Tax=Ipomoea trifida TaxID=35884 RepID=A0A904_IPOTF|nr:hypothetical protein [Ipomoea trifida]